MKPKILIIGPIEDFGGRELEAGFVASALKEEFNVSALSTGNFTSKSQFFEIIDDIEIISLKRLLFEKYNFLKPAALLSYIRNQKIEPIYFYVNTRINSSFIKHRENLILKEVIQKYDLIFIIANLQTLRTREIIEFASQYKKPLIFRTTGEIELPGKAPSYLKQVNLFLHHSVTNAKKLHKELNNDKYEILDQTSFMESELLPIPLVKKKVSKFVTITRLAPGKNLFNLISFFKDSCEKNDELLIVGTGKLYPELSSITNSNKNIKLIGHLSINELNNIYQEMDCAIIPTYTEAGPLVGIDAMAAGKVILSTKVGAMWERLQDSDNDFWFQPEDKESFKEQFERIKNLSPSEVYRIAEKNRKLYIQNHSKKEVSDKYRISVSQLL